MAWLDISSSLDTFDNFDIVDIVDILHSAGFWHPAYIAIMVDSIDIF